MSMLSKEEALDLLLSKAKVVHETERIEIEDGLGRILAEDLVSGMDVPAFDNSAMDGIAIALNGQNEFVISQRIAAGEEPASLQKGTAARIFTGAKVPEGAEAVVMQEDVMFDGEKAMLQKKPEAGENIRKRGEDIARGSIFLRAGTKLRPQELALIASVGISEIKVYRKLKIALFFTGSELVMPGIPLSPGKIYNSNRYALTALLESLHCEILEFGIVPDDLSATVSMLATARENADLVMTCGGVSVGEEDHVKAAVEKLGNLALWKVAVKPGKPLAFGDLSGVPFIGLPGNPVSAFLVFCIFARPYLLRSQGAAECLPSGVMLDADFEAKSGKRLEWLRARISEESSVVIHDNQGSAALSPLSWAEGIAEIPQGKTISKGEKVRFYSFAELLS